MLYAILKNRRQPFPNLWEEIDESSVTVSPYFLSRVRDLQLFLREKDSVSPSLYYRLELGWNMQEAAMNLLHRFCRTEQEYIV